MSLRLYGAARSRASRSLLALEELGVPYEHVPLSNSADDRAILAHLNPNRLIPVLEDGSLVLWESMAINLYLGDKYRGPLWPQTPEARAKLYQWSLWGQTEIDRRERHIARLSGDPARAEAASAERIAALCILNAALERSLYLLGDAFTLADVNVAATLSEPHEDGRVDGDLDPADHQMAALADWLNRCCRRESWMRVRGMP